MKDRDTVEGNARKQIGKAKQTVGRVTGDAELEAEGMAQRVKGAVQEGVGKTKDAARGVRKGIERPV